MVDLPSVWKAPRYEYKSVVISETTEEWKQCIREFRLTLADESSWKIIEASTFFIDIQYAVHVCAAVSHCAKFLVETFNALKI